MPFSDGDWTWKSWTTSTTVPQLKKDALTTKLYSQPEVSKENACVSSLAVVRSVTGALAVAAASMSILALNPKPSYASYGSSSVSITSPPTVDSVGLDDYLRLSDRKRIQRMSVVTCNPNDSTEKNLKCSKNSDLLLRKIQTYEQQLRDIEERVIERSEQSRKVSEEAEAFAKQIEEQLRIRQENQARLDAQPVWVSYFAAAVGSIVSTLVMHPLDTLKVRLMTNADDEDGEDTEIRRNSQPPQQQQEEEMTFASLPSTGSAGAVAALATGTDSGRGEWTREGRAQELASELLSLYNGVLPNIIKEAPASALYLGVYEAVRSQLEATALSSYPILVYLIAGAVGEVLGSVVRAPAEAVKVQIQTAGSSSSKPASTSTSVEDMPAAAAAAEDDVGGSVSIGVDGVEGGGGITLAQAVAAVLAPTGRANTIKAWSSSLWRDVPMGAVQLALFEGMKSYIISSPTIDLDVNSLLGEALLGAIGGGVGAYITAPADRITIQVLNSIDSNAAAQPEADGGGSTGSLKEIALSLYEREGVAGFFTGSVQRALYWAPAIGIFLSVYCSTRQFAVDHF
eukprot:CAMPEP_0174984180 /NCGR_PEP_ID=MMETSP0004_2-20121128/17577_1 /TAXON_ID=420556 /ORGANISM="Ochromonas sp., Strain CCMP1393" /LENGTH=569 /DNA_ID=CAMNT_0016236557 /DNA_START=149 /DNA_END=1859 /DNA_ORIENTATION=-